MFEFIPEHVPEFPLKKFEKVSGEAFFVDENLLVYINSFIFMHIVIFDLIITFCNILIW